MKLFALCLLVSTHSFAQNIVIRECEVQNEERASLRGNDVCVQELICKAVNESRGLYVNAEKLAYCFPDTISGRCPSDGDDCLYSARPISKSDIELMRYQELNESTSQKQPCEFSCAVRPGRQPNHPNPKNSPGAQ